ncbi:hypothetical protein BDK51DRAFT_26352, partial [Blyttiomyces helicus]
VRKRSIKCTLAFSLLDARNIPAPPSGLRVLGRQVRMALFDKTSVLSNIHSVAGVYNPEFEKHWRFSNKASLLFPRDDDNTCFLRSNDVDIRLSILFELCLVVARPDSETPGDVMELSCGWGLLPLFTADGGPVENKTYDIKLYGGTPFEKDVPLFEAGEKKGFLQALLKSSPVPRLNIRVWKLGKSAMEDLNQLPDVLISFLSAVPVLAMYRQILAEALEGAQRESAMSTIYEPAIAVLPQIAAQNDLLALLVHLWERALRGMKRGEKNSAVKMKQLFTETVLAVWPLLHVWDMPSYISGDGERLQLRQAFITRFQETGLLESLTKNPANHSIEPFSLDELQFDLLRCAMETREANTERGQVAF